MSSVVRVRGRGRPKLFTGKVSKKIAAILASYGLTGGAEYLANTGVQLKVGAAKTKLTVSLPTLATVAKENGVSFVRGRRKAA